MPILNYAGCSSHELHYRRRKGINMSLMKLGKRVIATALTAALSLSVLSFQNVTAQAASTSLERFSMEGYATVQNVTGGGILSESDSNYFKVSNANDFLKVLASAKKSKKAAVIELTADIALGSKEIGSALTTYSSVIQAASNQPLIHPTLLKTGVSAVNIKDMSNLTIFSENGAKITHACFNISKASNIMIRNITFDEIWEWDENTSGDYDRNDWDYITVQNSSTGIWIDHCTFYKAYDGIVDVKKASATVTTDVTISYSSFLPASEGQFFDDMMSKLEADPSSYPYYNSLITKYGMTKEQVRGYAYGQKKVHLIGASDSEANTQNLRITLANNYYKDSMDRLPRIRAGYAHVYNCIMDSDYLYEVRNSIKNSTAKSKIVSNGAVSTVGAQVLLQNTNIKGIINALLSGNGNSSAGYVGAVNTRYSLGGAEQDLKVVSKTSEKLTLNADAFLSNLPYEAVRLYDVNSLSETVLPYIGSKAVTMSAENWMKTSYEGETLPEETPEVKPEVKPEATPEVKPEVTPEATPEVTPEVKPEATPEATPEQEKVVYSHDFTGNNITSTFYKIKGNFSSSKGTVTYNGKTYKTAIKMESSTSISFTIPKNAVITLVANTGCSKNIEINQKSYSFTNGLLTAELAAGTYEITKEDSNVNIYIMEVEF